MVTIQAYWHLYLKAKERGAKIVVIDPRKSETAVRADKWVSIIPGTDTALGLGMIRWIAANGKLDKPFLKQHTGAVYLVDKDGKLMREDAKDPNSYLVFDEKSQKLVRHDAKNIDPALEVKAGSPYRTVLSMVLEQAEPWTPEAVADTTGVPAATVVERFDSAAMMLRERRRAATARAGELELSIEANAVKADEAASELARATAQYEEAAAELDAAKKKVSDLDAVYRDLGVRRGALERELAALSKDAEKMTAERETARRRHAENTEALSHGLAHVQVVEGRAAELALELARAQEEAERAAAGAAAAPTI